MKKQLQLLLITLLFFNGFLMGQNVQLEGYIFEGINRGFLKEVKVGIYEAPSEVFFTKLMTNSDGLFTVDLPMGKDYIF